MTAPRTGRMASVLGETGLILGNLQGQGDLELRGRVQGDISLEGRCVVHDTGLVLGTIEASHITVHGTVRGDLLASDTVMISSAGKVEGNLVAPRVELESGARVRGQVRSGPDETRGNDSERELPPRHAPDQLPHAVQAPEARGQAPDEPPGPPLGSGSVTPEPVVGVPGQGGREGTRRRRRRRRNEVAEERIPTRGGPIAQTPVAQTTVTQTRAAQTAAPGATTQDPSAPSTERGAEPPPARIARTRTEETTTEGVGRAPTSAKLGKRKSGKPSGEDILPPKVRTPETPESRRAAPALPTFVKGSRGHLRH